MVLAFCLALALPALAAAPVEAAAATSSSHTWWVAVGAQSPNGAISDMAFGTPRITIDNGDTVNFFANSLEIHTVTFTATNMPPSYPFPQNTTGYAPGALSATYHGHMALSSELLSTFNFGPAVIGGFHVTTNFKVTFWLGHLTTPVTIPYYCLVHPGMMGWVTIQPKGWSYPHTQSYYTNLAQEQAEAAFAKGFRAMEYEEDHFATNHRVSVGVTSGMSDVMRFMTHTQYIGEHQSITFTNNSMGPHTVTFGTDSTTCPPDNGPPCDTVSPNSTSAAYSGGYFNFWLNPGQSITITFNVRDGTYGYHCALHDYMGMVASVVVK